MPKMKTRRAAKKRYSLTSSGKVKYKRQGLRHNLSKKSTKRKRSLRQSGVLAVAETERVHRLLPYG